MGLDIVTNVMAQQASNDLAANESNMQGSLEKLSSGHQINTAADDASGLVISNHLQAQIGAFTQAQSNTQAGINVVQTANGALNEVSTILQRVNTLAVESQNSSAQDPTAQQAAQAEVNQALTSITNIAATTVYGNQQLLVNGTSSTVSYTFQTGWDGSAASQVSFQVTALNLANLGLETGTLSGAGPGGVVGSTGIGSVVGNVSAGNHTLSITAATAETVATASVLPATNANGATFSMNVNGTSYTVTLSMANETQANLVTDINKAVSFTVATAANSAIGSGVTITNATTGAAGSITFGGSSTILSTLGLSNAVNTAGADATVSLDGGTATDVTAAQNVANGTFSLAAPNGTGVEVTLNGPLSGGITTVGTASKLTSVGFAAGGTAGDVLAMQVNGANYNVTLSHTNETALQLATDINTATQGAVTASGATGQVVITNGSTGLPGAISFTTSADVTTFGLATGTATVAAGVNQVANAAGSLTVTQNALTASNSIAYSVTSGTAIDQVQSAISTVSSMQGKFGAFQNELQDISDNETVGIQNLTASNANIADTNMASQMVNFTQDQVLVQAGVSMLAQANQIPQYVLKLLG
jgi:flagellin